MASARSCPAERFRHVRSLTPLTRRPTRAPIRGHTVEPLGGHEADDIRDGPRRLVLVILPERCFVAPEEIQLAIPHAEVKLSFRTTFEVLQRNHAYGRGEELSV